MMLLKSPKLRTEFALLLEANLPKIASLADGRATLFSGDDLASVSGFAQKIAFRASPSLKRDIHRFCMEIGDKQLLRSMGVLVQSRDSQAVGRAGVYQAGFNVGHLWASSADVGALRRLRVRRNELSRDEWVELVQTPSSGDRLLRELSPDNTSGSFEKLRHRDGDSNRFPQVWFLGFFDGLVAHEKRQSD